MMNINHISEGLEAVDRHLLDSVDSEVELLQEASTHILGSGGKRLRPQITLLSVLAAGGEDFEPAIPIATAIEMVHTATLVHDDINDHSLLRRGRPSVHARWGRTFALLTGDFLFTKVYQLMAPFNPEYNVIMAGACSELVEGETLQAAAAKAGTINRETYKRIVSLKTASLFDAGARMGAMIGGGDETVVEALAEYSYNLGIAFQIIDDVLDLVGDPETMGKPVGTDLSQNRGVMVAVDSDPAILSLATNGVATPVADAQDEADPIKRMMASLQASGAVEMARIQAYEMAQRARNTLAAVPPSAARDELELLIDSVVEREN